MNTASYGERRNADIALRDGARRVLKRSKRFSRKRWAARATVAAFWIRVRRQNHAYPNKRMKVWARHFKYGYYGGVGNGIPAGEYRSPKDDLDALYLAHDKVYAPPGALAKWGARRGRRNRA